MTLHFPSILVGIFLAFVPSITTVGIFVVGDWWRERKARKAALHKLLADTAITELERME